MYKHIVVGVDQSYTRTGLTVVADGAIKDIKSIDLHKYENNSMRRRVLSQKLGSLLDLVVPMAEQVTVICERTRLHGGPDSFINLDAIKAIGSLTAVIVDTAALRGLSVYSVDTRCWKARVVGTCKPRENSFGVPPEKWPTIQWVCARGFEHKLLHEVTNPRKRKGTFERNGKRWMYDNDAADSAGIAMFGVVGDPSKLQLEC